MVSLMMGNRMRRPKAVITSILNAAIQDGIPGLSLAIANSNGLLWSAVAGHADIGKRLPIRTDHLFGIGSITKTFVAIVLVQLAEEGRLNLDHTPMEILGAEVVGQVANSDQASLAQLLNHTGGIPSWEDDPIWIREGRGEKSEVGRIWNRTDVLSYLENTPPKSEPGKEYSYSNTNHTIIGLIIEKITGNNVVDEIRNRILTPARISDIYLEGFQTISRSRLPRRYHYATPEFKHTAGIQNTFNKETQGLIDASNSNLSVEWTAGGLVATASDLALYATAISSGKFLRPKSMSFVQTWFRVDDNVEVGHGLFRIRKPNISIIGHSGSVLGFTGAMYWHDEADIAVAILANVGTMHAGKDLPSASTIALDPLLWEQTLKMHRLLSIGGMKSKLPAIRRTL